MIGAGYTETTKKSILLPRGKSAVEMHVGGQCILFFSFFVQVDQY